MKIRVDKTAEERMAKPLDLCECTHPHFKHTGGAQCRGVVSPHRCPCTEYVWSGKTSERSPTSETHRIAEALKSTGLGGIYDTFTDPADAIVQMSTYIAHLKGELTAAACDVASERSARERAERAAKHVIVGRYSSVKGRGGIARVTIDVDSDAFAALEIGFRSELGLSIVDNNAPHWHREVAPASPVAPPQTVGMVHCEACGHNNHWMIVPPLFCSKCQTNFESPSPVATELETVTDD